jgi:hypothetical protein
MEKKGLFNRISPKTPGCTCVSVSVEMKKRMKVRDHRVSFKILKRKGPRKKEEKKAILLILHSVSGK